jgi:hypothetical protein
MFLALLALAIPLPALALSGEQEPAAQAPVALAVSTSLESCGIADTQVVCKLGVSFNSVPGATSYTASVTRADGSVVDYGAVGSGTSLWVPYVGAGSYSVRVSAFGTPPAAEEEDGVKTNVPGELITSAAAEAEPTREARDAEGGNAEITADPGAEPAAGETTQAHQTAAPGADPGAPPPAQSCTPAPAPQPAPTPQPLPEPPPVETDPENPDEDGDGIDDAEERAAYELALSEQQAQALAQQAQLPEAIECPAP